MNEPPPPGPSIVERLRAHVQNRGGPTLGNGAWDMMLEAANEIERLNRIIDDMIEDAEGYAIEEDLLT